ncbi:SDR family oxidoreductase [Phanerochaete sordida]|uniref:SDR family oxidoreductase n=1 Tax=Phanerochaete sordida TaxID=48140 RepID=A0A9P3GI56_9APHY|nr:SDR family oxidoreductase [Phanerochaete sordida]
MSPQLVWLITGTSYGLGRDLTLAALARGDKVIATARARSFARLADLQAAGADVLELDTTAPLPALHAIAEKAVALHGRVDVLVNNAGYIEVGALEELTPEETFNQFNTNVFGCLNVARAFLPYMRPRKTGTVVWLGSIGGWRGSAGFGAYSATKYTVRALAESMHKELAPLGLRSLCFELGYFRTTFLSADHRGAEKARIADYAEIHTKLVPALAAHSGKQLGDPLKGVEVMLDVVRGEGVAAGRATPVVLGLGSDFYADVKSVLEGKLQELEEWKDVICSTDHKD